MVFIIFYLIVHGRITQEDYDNKLHEYKQKQHILGIELEEHTNADHEYHIHIKTVYSLSTRLDAIFESSELDEKRAILNYLLQNPTVKRKKLYFSIASPFSELLELASSSEWLRLAHKFRTQNWKKIKSELQFSQVLELV